MFVTNLSSALPTLSRATARGVLSRARGVRWIVTIWCLLFTVSVFSATHFPDGQAADDALEAIEAVVDDMPGDAPPVAKPSKGFERAIKVALGKAVKQPGQCFSVEHWVAHASDAPDAPTTSAAAPRRILAKKERRPRRAGQCGVRGRGGPRRLYVHSSLTVCT